jgi:hypothetical protein
VTLDHQGVLMRGRPRPPEVGEKIRATLRGRRQRLWEEIRRFYDDAQRSQANRRAGPGRGKRPGVRLTPAPLTFAGVRQKLSLFGNTNAVGRR